MKNKLIRKIIGGLSLTSVLFVFQACYGTPQDFEPDFRIEGQVKSKSTGLPIEGIKVSIVDYMQYEFTNDKGEFSIYTVINNDMRISFEDLDSTNNGSFLNRDTLLTNIQDNIYLDIKLESK